MSVTRVKTSEGWVDLQAVGPKGDKGDPGYTEYAWNPGGWCDGQTIGNAWSTLKTISGSLPPVTTPAGAFTRNADNSITVRDAGWYLIQGTAGYSAAGTQGLSIGNANNAEGFWDKGVEFGASASSNQHVAATVQLAAGAKIYFTGLCSVSATCVLYYASIARVGAGPQGPQGDQGIIAAYSQPNDPGAVPNGTIWIDTDEGVPLPTVNNIAQTYSVTAGYTKDRTFNPAATSIGEIAAVLATFIDDAKAAGWMNP